MTPPDSTPKLPLWTFLVTDAVLLGAALFIAQEAARPLSNSAIIAIVACVLAGALIVLVPLVMRLERQKNETLDERQRELEALARTLTASAEQISIAASGLHQIAELTQKNLRHAEHLPQKLQEKIAEFKAQLANATDTEKEELENELVALRTSESERLQATADSIARTVAEFTKLEAATHQHLISTNEALAKVSSGSLAAIAKAQAAAEHAVGHARTESARHLAESAGNAANVIASAKVAALSEIDARFAEAGAALVAQVTRELVKLELAAAARAAPPEPSAVESTSNAQTTTAPTEAEPPAVSAPPDSAPKTEPAEPAARRPRKPRREAEAPAATAELPPAPATESSPPPATDAALAPEPAPIPAGPVAESAPVAPDATPPIAAPPEPVAPAAADTGAEPPAPPVEPPPIAEEPKPARKRARKAEYDASASLDLGIDDAPAPAERVLTSDGATRLMVTAYIGIGNRLFIRGAGGGLSWEKGVPLQFVSIGKWRWETNDATSAVEFKLYKNDEQECASLGLQTVDPGYQQEMTATF